MANAPGPRRSILPILIGGLAILAALLVVAGRFLDAASESGWQDPFYSVLLAFTLDGSFLGQQNIVTLIGAFAAALVLYLAVFGSLWVVFRRRLLAWRASRLRNHVVIVGDNADAEELAEALRAETNVVLVGAPHAAAHRLIGLERPASNADLISASNADDARAVVVMLGDEKLNAAIATSVASGRGGAATPTIWCRTGDRLVADRVAGVETGAARILVFDEAQMMARDLFARHPAHALAERMAAERVHLLVIGFGRLGQAGAEEAIFSGLAAGLGKPMVTIVDRQAGWAERVYRESRPALDKAADVAFIEAELITVENAPVLTAATLSALAARDEIARVTAILICLGNDADNVRFALALPDIRRREGRYFAPAFMRLRDPDAESVVLAPADANVLDPNSGVVPLMRPTRLIASDILDSAHRDEAARRLHEAYSGGTAVSSGASADWNNLPETYRRANRRSADHIASKLFSLGLVSEHDAHEPVLVETGAHRRHIAPLAANDRDPRLAVLAALEHQRWSADRAIDGWSYGPVRDDDRKLHPLLQRADYDALPPVEQEKDRRQIRTILSSIVAAEGRGAMPEIRVGLAGHRNLAPAEEKRAIASLVGELLPRLALPDHVITLVSPLAPGADMALSEALAAALQGRVGQLRFIMPEAVPYRLVLDTVAAEEGGDTSRAVEAMLVRRRALFARFARVDIVRIGFAGVTDYSYRRDKAQFERGLARANAYLARRCDLLAVLWDGQPARGPGGTAELVQYWQTSANIEGDMAFAASPVRPPAADRAGSLIVARVERTPAAS